jgi:hypothetical protein
MNATAAYHHPNVLDDLADVKQQVYGSVSLVTAWLEENEYAAYDTFDGLNSRLLRPLSFEIPFLRTVLQQGIRRFPFNLRPLVGISRSRSTKGMGFIARGFIRMHSATADPSWSEKAESALTWLAHHQSPGYSGAAWANHFDYQSRTFYLPRDVPTVVWTSLVGHAFFDAFDHYKDESYLQIGLSACEHIVSDLQTTPYGDSLCISYVPTQNTQVHNANTLGGSLLARGYKYSRNNHYGDLARGAMLYTAKHQHPDGSWFYGEAPNLQWVDNFHTAYVLDCFKQYSEATGDRTFDQQLETGYEYWKRTFFLEDGTPRYYDHKTLPIDIQCCSQAIDTLTFFSDRDPGSIELAVKVALWTIRTMQDKSGYFYYRRYSPWLTNKTPTLHWGQATMLCALAGLYRML